MLTHIHIWNFAIVEKLDIEFEAGLTVLTGETGAGKSILLQALGLALGDRADSSVIRHGAEKAEISVSFYTTNTAAAEQWLAEHEMQSDGECIIRRSIARNGPSRAFINGIPATVQQLKQLGEQLVDIHGQHEHQSLMHRDNQRQLLDDFAALGTLGSKVSESYERWRDLEHQLSQLQQAGEDRDSRLELLRYQVKELQSLSPQPGEFAELEQEYKRLANAQQLLQTAQRVVDLLDENEAFSVNNALSRCEHDIQELAEVDANLNGIAEMLSSATVQLQETTSELRHYADSLELDPERLSEVEQRLNEMHSLSRKHHTEPEKLVELLPQLEQELENLEQSEVRLEGLQNEIRQAREQYLQEARSLSSKRQAAARKLGKQVSEQMQDLSMEGGKFEIQLEPLSEDKCGPAGLDRVEFLVSANPGQPAKPLTKVASGGELSRISLAIQVSAAEATRIPTLVFDEVDVGIGGRVAEIVGHQLRDLAHHRQVLCVTHLPQVAALGHQHLQVSKQAKNNSTLTLISALNDQQRIDEVARMLGGIEITDQTLSHAKEMIERAQA